METAKLEHMFKDDMLFKLVFVKHPDLLKRLVAELLNIRYESIGDITVKNPDILPEVLGGKYCRLDINMMVDGQLVDLEIQVKDEGNYPERSLYYWARDYSTTLTSGGKYEDLLKTIVISILDFNLFDCEEFHSEFQALEVTRHTPLTDKLSLHYFELPKLPQEINDENEQKLWLALFRAETEEELARIKAMEVPVMEQAINAYTYAAEWPPLNPSSRARPEGAHNEVTETDEYKALERARHFARLNEASALHQAREEEKQKWQGVVAEKDAEIAKLKAQLKHN